jgi:hypothetical protein
MRSLILAALVCTAGLAWAEEPSSPFGADAAAPHVAGSLGATDDAITAKIRQELDKPTTLDFVETPLNEVIAYFADLHKIPIQLDTKHLEEAGVAGDTVVNSHLTGVKLRNALDLMLENLDLAWIVKNQVLVITTKDAASEHLVTRVYPVADLVQIDGDCVHYGELLKAVTSTVDPGGWDEVGGPGSIEAFRGSLVVHQTESTHEKLVDLFRQLREPAVVTAREDVPAIRSSAKAATPDPFEPRNSTRERRPQGGGGGFF